MFSRISHRNTDAQERNEGPPVEPQVKGVQDNITETQSGGSKKRTLQKCVDSVGSSLSKYFDLS